MVNLESENGEQSCRHGDEDMRAQACLGGVPLPLEADHCAENGRDQQADGDDMLGQIGLDEAEFVADIHGSISVL
ncbi:hypothetical protein D3C71_1982250 [compost metagenome]